MPREIVVLSGKGGTGKTTVSAALAQLAGKAVICDLDVDAPDLHLLLAPTRRNAADFFAGHRAEIDPVACDGCGICAEVCNFEAISQGPGGYAVDAAACEGCKVCVQSCPAGAIAFPVQRRGRWYRSDTRFGPMVHAQLFPGEENSGLLVSRLKADARELAKSAGLPLVLADGSPGVGCPVIASLTNTDLAVVVTEPSPAGRHDLERIVDLASHFRVPAIVILNRSDLDAGQRDEIRRFCRNLGLPLIAEMPFSRGAVDAVLAGRTVIEHGVAELARPLSTAWNRISEMTAEPQAA